MKLVMITSQIIITSYKLHGLRSNYSDFMSGQKVFVINIIMNVLPFHRQLNVKLNVHLLASVGSYEKSGMLQTFFDNLQCIK